MRACLAAEYASFRSDARGAIYLPTYGHGVTYVHRDATRIAGMLGLRPITIGRVRPTAVEKQFDRPIAARRYRSLCRARVSQCPSLSLSLLLPLQKTPGPVRVKCPSGFLNSVENRRWRKLSRHLVVDSYECVASSSLCSCTGNYIDRFSERPKEKSFLCVFLHFTRITQHSRWDNLIICNNASRLYVKKCMRLLIFFNYFFRIERILRGKERKRSTTIPCKLDRKRILLSKKSR